MDKERVPTLADYAVIIEWMRENPGQDTPLRMKADYRDAINRAALRRLALEMRAQANG